RSLVFSNARYICDVTVNELLNGKTFASELEPIDPLPASNSSFPMLLSALYICWMFRESRPSNMQLAKLFNESSPRPAFSYLQYLPSQFVASIIKITRSVQLTMSTCRLDVSAAMEQFVVSDAFT